MSRWSDAFHALTPPLTHETHGDTCADAGSHTDCPTQLMCHHLSHVSLWRIGRTGHCMGRERSATAIMCRQVSHVSGRWRR
jgi:hypothetical protein